MKKFYSNLFIINLLLLCSIAVFAQKDKPKVIKYFAPKYPVSAQAVRATGTIDVLVKIDKDGKVTSTNAISGHPLLRKACENAAMQWLFTPDSSHDEREVKITFLLRIGDRNKKDKVKFKKPYTIELVGARVRIVNTVDY
jgi:TonB family protein